VFGTFMYIFFYTGGDGVFIQRSLSFVIKLCIFSWRLTKLRSGNSLNCPATCFPNVSYWSSRYRFCERFCNFEIADSTATILSGSRLFLGGGFLSGETFFAFGLSWSLLMYQQFPS
jgi:hypothetical protein